MYDKFFDDGLRVLNSIISNNIKCKSFMGKITKEEVESFLHGSDPMERIIKIELDDEYNSNEVTIFYRDENGKKQSIKDDFHPFLWCKANAARRLYNGNRQLIKTKLAEFGIACKKLRTTTDDGFEPERMNNGYKILFYAVRKMSYTQFLKFFEDGDVPVYPKQGHKEKGNNNYICVKPNEQYMISTGKRLFKGFDDYNELVRVQWDLETTGLNGKEDTIDQIGIRSNKGFERILTIEGKGAEKMDSQYDAMEEFFSAIEQIDPDVISGYNSENFDWPFVDDQYEKYDTNMTYESSKYLRKGVYKKKKEAILKLGGEMERYRPTVMYSVNITDGLHAVRRAMALDSNIKSATLKNIAKEFKLNPKNRVYVPGNDISDIWNDLNKNYAFNDRDGDWYRYDPSYVKPKPNITPKYTVKEYDILIEEDKATYERYQKFINNIENNVNDIANLKEQFDNFYNTVNDPEGDNIVGNPFFNQFEGEEYEFVDKETGEVIEYERKYPDGITGQELYDEERERLIAESKAFVKGYNGRKFTLYTRNYVADGYELVTGRYIVERYLMDDLRETDAVELQFNQSNFLISKMLPLSFERACTMGTAGIWKYIMLAFSYEQNLAIPESENAVLPIGGLSRLEKTGLCTNVAKLDYNSLYPSIDLTYGYKSEVDIADSMQTMLEYVLSQREYYKGLKKKYAKEADKFKEEREMYVNTLREDPRYKHLSDSDFELILEKDKKATELLNQYNDAKRKSSMYDKMQLPLKILGNSWFGSVSSNVFPWNSGKVGALITSTGRMMFRLLTNHFMKLGYTPIVGDTDGINFKIADKLRYTDEHPYFCNGLGRNGKPGKPYTGVAADVQEFEDLYLRGKNGIDIDEVVPSSINFKRKTYADLLEDGKVKLVGNSIKSKKMPIYIEKFLDKAIPLLLYDKGKEFINYYYDYINQIYNYKIPLKDIASVGKIKISLNEYKEKCKEVTSAGTKKSRQAWYELAIRDGLHVDMGDTIYYINTGDKKTSSDVQRVTKYYVKERTLLGDEETVDKTKEFEKEYNKLKKQFKDNPNDETFSKYVKDKGKFINLSEYVAMEHKEAVEKDELIFNCILLPKNIIEDDEDHFCDEDTEYNVTKYIEMLNKRITTLLVCFKKSMRETINEKGKIVSNILISNPKERKSFTDEECKLTSGEPMNESDEDKVEDVMMLEDKEIKFWTSIDQKPPYIDECDLDWEQIKAEYFERQKVLEREGIKQEVEAYKEYIEKQLTKAEYDSFMDNGEIPQQILGFCDIETNSLNLVSKKFGVVIGSLMDIIDKDWYIKSVNEELSITDE